MTEALPTAATGDLGRWMRDQARREQGAVRLEDALLGDRYARYFSFRLRFFVARTAIAAVVLPSASPSCSGRSRATSSCW